MCFTPADSKTFPRLDWGPQQNSIIVSYAGKNFCAVLSFSHSSHPGWGAARPAAHHPIVSIAPLGASSSSGRSWKIVFPVQKSFRVLLLPPQFSSISFPSSPFSKYLTSAVFAPSHLAFTGRSFGNKGLKSFLRLMWWNRLSLSSSSFHESTPFAVPLGSVNLPPWLAYQTFPCNWKYVPLRRSRRLVEQPVLKPNCINLEKVMDSCFGGFSDSPTGLSRKTSSSSGPISSWMTSSSKALTPSSKRSTGKLSSDSSLVLTASLKGNLSAPVCSTTMDVRTWKLATSQTK